jgi:adenine deaminase
MFIVLDFGLWYCLYPMENAANFEQQKINTNTVGSLADPDFSIADLKRRIDLATGQKKVDLVVKNASIVNVFSGEIHKGDVAIADGIFVGFGQTGEYRDCDSNNVIDIQGRFMCPGLIDGN